jgi:hypothetical protein
LVKGIQEVAILPIYSGSMEGVELEKGKAVEDHGSVEREERSNLG